jgi:hypothetical protein
MESRMNDSPNEYDLFIAALIGIATLALGFWLITR